MSFLIETFSAWNRQIAQRYAVGFFLGFFAVVLPETAWKIWVVEKPATIRLAEESLVEVRGEEVLVHLDLRHTRNFCQGALITRLLVHYPPGVKPNYTNFDLAQQLTETSPYMTVPGEYHFNAIMHLRSPLPKLAGQWQFLGSSYNGCTLLGKLGADTALISPLVPVKVEN